MKKLIVFLLFVLGGCERPVNEWYAGDSGKLTIKGLEDCTVVSVHPGGGDYPFIVVRCPHSTTSTTASHFVGKIMVRQISVVDSD